MKRGAIVMVAGVFLTAAGVFGESLADAARREEARRRGGAEERERARVLVNEDLESATEGRGTLTVLDGPAPPAVPVDRGTEKELEAKRVVARKLVARRYAALASAGRKLVRAGVTFEHACGMTKPPPACRPKKTLLGNQAVEVGRAVDEAEDAGRQGYLLPGEVREAREHSGLDDHTWQEIMRTIREYRSAAGRVDHGSAAEGKGKKR